MPAHGPRLLPPLQRRLRRVGTLPLLLLGLAVELGWAFVGSLALGLRERNEGAPALVWLAGTVLLGLVIGVAAWFAGPPRQDG